MSPNLKRAIIKTIAYSDIFDYPLNLAEIKKYLIGFPLKDKNWDKTILDSIKNIQKIRTYKGFFFFSKRLNAVAVRSKKYKISLKKINFARKISKILSLFPAIKVIGVTGSLALLSSDQKDDIDLLIITSKNRIWLTRFVCVFLLKLIGVYRQPKQKEAPDKICPNMLLDEDNLTLPVKERDLYSAHEIVQMNVLSAKPGFENILIKNNLWVKKYLPNAFDSTSISKTKSGSNNFIFSYFFDFIENLLKKFQLFYMKKRRTSEVIRNGYLRFHPKDARKTILKHYQKNLILYLT